MKTQGLTLALLLGYGGLACAALPPGMSGAWYNPAQSGHGISLEVLDDRRAIAYWFVYDAAGAPIHLYIDGQVQGHSITGPAYLSRGMPFGSFDSSRHTIGVWGHVRLDFQDCAHATLHYDADGPRGGASFGSGDIAMARLSQLAGLDCALSDTGRLPQGLYTATYLGQTHLGTQPMAAAVDPDGVFWAANVSGSLSPNTPSPQPSPPVVIGQVDKQGNANVLKTRAYGNVAFARERGFAEPFDVRLNGNAGSAQPGREWLRAFAFNADTSNNARIQRDFRLADLVGLTFETKLIFQIAPQSLFTRVSADGSLCLDLIESSPSPDCEYRGDLVAVYPGWTFFAFTLKNPRDRLGNAYSGRGWVEYGANGPERLVLVGDNTRGDGLGVVATVVTP